MAIAEGLAALNSIRSLYEIAKEVRNSNDTEKLRAAAAQMFDLALAAREQTAALHESKIAAMAELAALKAEIEKAKRFDQEAEYYTRERTETGATVYREKDAAGPQGQSPYFCPTCFGDKKLSILNPAKGQNTRLAQCDHACATCKTTMPLAVLNRL
jgi:hypothetical protein